jgi:hypothetical protein
VASGKREGPVDRAELTLYWFDKDASLSTEQDLVTPGKDGSDQFIWRQAPINAAYISAELSSPGKRTQCMFDRAALFDLP